MAKGARYCKHCGQPVPPIPALSLAAIGERLARVEQQLRTLDGQDPRIGAEGWTDTIRRIARDVLQKEGRPC